MQPRLQDRCYSQLLARGGDQLAGQHRPRAQTAPGPEGHSELGVLRELQDDPLHFFLSCHREFGEVVRLRIGPRRLLYLVSHPEAIRHILVTNRDNYTKGESWEKQETDSNHPEKDLIRRGSLLSRRFLLGDGLLTSEGSLWKRQRRTIHPVFVRSRLNEFGQIMQAQIQQMLSRWDQYSAQQSEFDLDEEMARLGLDIIVRTLFGEEVSLSEAERINQIFRRILHLTNARTNRMFDVPERRPQGGDVEFHGLVEELDEIIYVIIARRTKSNDQGRDFLSLLLSARDDEDGQQMEERQVRDEVVTFFLAGHETTSSALSWTFYLLARHPEWEGAVQREVDRVIGSNRLPAVDDLQELRCSHRVIEESMRLYPPAWLIMRHTVGEDEIFGYRMPAGTDVIISPYVVHRHKQFWKDPERFDPNRFQSTSASPDPFLYLPFGGGPRVCVGRNFALMEAQLVLCSVVQRFSLKLVAERSVRPKARFILQPETGIQVRLLPRAG